MRVDVEKERAVMVAEINERGWGRKHPIHQLAKQIERYTDSAYSPANSFLEGEYESPLEAQSHREPLMEHGVASQAEGQSSRMLHTAGEEYDLEKPIRGEIALWRAVITQALMDARSQSAKPEMRYDRNQARAWLTGQSKDFFMVCEMAQMDPSYVRKKALMAMNLVRDV